MASFQRGNTSRKDEENEFPIPLYEHNVFLQPEIITLDNKKGYHLERNFAGFL